jgi:hypothetical protein
MQENEDNLDNPRLAMDAEMYNEELDMCQETIPGSFASSNIKHPEPQHPKFF